METILDSLFIKKDVVARIQERLPKLFSIANLECSRAGKIGMEVGSMREQILIALLVHTFGEKSVKTDIPITKSEVDVIVKDVPISIKTVTGSGGIKAIWTVDSKKVMEFYNSYKPECELLLAVIRWNESVRRSDSGLFLIPLSVQKEVLDKIGKESYLKIPKQGTNPRGVEITRKAIIELINEKETRRIEIDWKNEVSEHKTYERWLEMWEK